MEQVLPVGYLANINILGIVLGSVVPEELRFKFYYSFNFLALLVNDFRKFKNIIVMIGSGLVATIGYELYHLKHI